MPPEGQAQERKNKQRTNHNDENTHVPPLSVQAPRWVPKPTLHRHRERRVRFFTFVGLTGPRCDVSHITFGSPPDAHGVATKARRRHTLGELPRSAPRALRSILKATRRVERSICTGDMAAHPP